MKLPKGVERLPVGVEIHGNQIRLCFMYAGKRCRESLSGVSKVSKATLAYAENKRKLLEAGSLIAGLFVFIMAWGYLYEAICRA